MLERVIQSFIMQASGYIHLQHGDLENADAAYRKTNEILADTEIRDIYLYYLPYHAEVLLYLGQHEESRETLEAKHHKCGLQEL